MFLIVVTFPAKLILWPHSITGGFRRVRNCEILSAVLAERLQGNTQLLFQTHLRESEGVSSQLFLQSER